MTVTAGNTAVFGLITVGMNGNANNCTVTLGVNPALPSGAVAVFGNSPVTHECHVHLVLQYHYDLVDAGRDDQFQCHGDEKCQLPRQRHGVVRDPDPDCQCGG